MKEIKLNQPKIKATDALFIKLGESGVWASDCLNDGTLRLDYREIPHKLCAEKRWDEVLAIFLSRSGSKGAATRHLNQVRKFYEASIDTLWITFHASKLYWCISEANVEALEDGTTIRRAKGGWSDKNIFGIQLSKKNISGKVLATHGYRGTICSAPELHYLINKINGTVGKHITEAQAALDDLVNKLVPIIKKLHQNDFELLIDLIFRQGGWRRIGVSGGTEKDIDLDLILPLTEARIAVQVKSQANENTYTNYQNRFSDMDCYERFYFVTHSPAEDLIKHLASTSDTDYSHECEFWGPNEIARYVVENGLVGWLLDKAT